jgi:hypothetical protein
MKINLAALEKRYSEMDEMDWSQLSRQDLSAEARLVYDRVARRRGGPTLETVAAKIEPPDVDKMLRRTKRRMTVVKLRFVLLGCVYLGLCLLLGLHPSIATAVFGGIIYVFWGTARGDKLVLWLRRFHMRRKGGLGFGRLLEQAASGLGFAVTVQDSVVKRSFDMGLSGLHVLFFLMLAVMYVLLLVFRDLFQDRVWIALLLFTALPVAICLPFYLRHSVMDLKPETAQNKVLRLVRKIETKRGWHTSGIFLVRCGESFWQQVVELFIASASVVVIDATEISDNVIWELQTALRLIGPSSIVLAYGVNEGAAREFPSERREDLLRGTAGDWIDQAHIYLYPLLKSQLNEEQWHSRRKVTEDLRRLLAEGIANTEYRHQLEDATVPQLSEA